MNTALATLTNKLAARLDMGNNGQELMETLKATAFGRTQTPISDAQMTALLVVANQYGLNPWTKEIYAFPDKQAGIVPVVGVDGWARIINEHPQFDGMEFRQAETMVRPEGARCEAPEWIECLMYRKDRTRPIVVREYLDETYRKPFSGRGQQGSYTVEGPWQTHPKRFLRHKAMIQCARLAFGYGGIFDQDEAETIVERHMGPAEVVPEAASTAPKPASRTDAIKAHLNGRRRPSAPPETPATPSVAPEAPRLDGILAEIAEAHTLSDLDAIGTRAKLLFINEQKVAGKAWKARKADLSAPAPEQPVPDLDLTPPAEAEAMLDSVRRALASSKTQQDIDESLDFARTLPLTDAQKQQVNQLADEAARRIG